MAETRKLLQQERWALLPEDILYRRVNSLTSPMWTSTLTPWSQHRLSTELHQTCLSVTFLQLSAWHPQFPFMGLKDPLLNAFFLILVHRSNRDKPDDKTDRLYTVAKLISQAKSPMLKVGAFLLPSSRVHGQQLTETGGEMQQNGFVATPDWPRPFQLTANWLLSTKQDPVTCCLWSLSLAAGALPRGWWQLCQQESEKAVVCSRKWFLGPVKTV